MAELADYQWLETKEAVAFLQKLRSHASIDPFKSVQSLRQQLSPSQVFVLLEQMDCLPTAKKKFRNPENWLWTKQLIEQASDEWTSMETAADFPSGSHLLDICCGAGSDAIALSRQGRTVLAIDSSSIACELTRQNARAHRVEIPVQKIDALEATVESNCFLHIDPDRRGSGSRVTHLEGMSPPWSFIEKLIDQCRGGSVKLAPGLRVDNSKPSIQPETKRFLSRDGSVRQQRWYWGIDRWPKGSVVVSMHLKQSDAPESWHHEIFEEANTLRNNSSEQSLASEFADESTVTDQIGDFIADYDPGLRAAEQSASFAIRHRLRLLGSEHGYFTSSRPEPHPMVRWYRVLEELPVDKKQLRLFSKQHRPFDWELKCRGVDIDLEQIRRELARDASSPSRLTIIFTQIKNRYRAIACKEIR